MKSLGSYSAPESDSSVSIKCELFVLSVSWSKSDGFKDEDEDDNEDVEEDDVLDDLYELLELAIIDNVGDTRWCDSDVSSSSIIDAFITGAAYKSYAKKKDVL